ncbi:hypothetical protein ACH41H_05150 [Streptomyces sp. NPDC020800]|uniref:hypothetical protein n=1 Tax=Streptomyces sp. NPDC020800 TaxID=3365092 RepID=UPI00379E5416
MRISTRIRITATATVVAFAGAALPASAGTPGLGSPHIIRHLDLAAGQQPENLTTEPNGSLDVTMSFAHQIVRLTTDGGTHVLGTLPAPPNGTDAPLTGRAFIGGIVRLPDGTLCVLYSAGTADLTGLWRLRPGGVPSRVVPLPANSVPNGLALHGGYLYATDSSLGAIWRMTPEGTAAAVWKKAPELAARTPSGFGANGLKIRDNAVWVTTMDKGTLLRVPIGRHGAPGAVHTVAAGLGAVDDFTFTGHGDDVLAADNAGNRVELVRPDGSHTVVLTAADGLQNPTSLARRGETVYVADASYYTHTDPNLIAAPVELLEHVQVSDDAAGTAEPVPGHGSPHTDRAVIDLSGEQSTASA